MDLKLELGKKYKVMSTEEYNTDLYKGASLNISDVKLKVGDIVEYAVDGYAEDMFSFRIKVGEDYYYTDTVGQSGFNFIELEDYVEDVVVVVPPVVITEDDIYFAKLNPLAIIPSKRAEDMCYDIYACFDKEYMIIDAHSTVLIPTGICSAFSEKYGISLRERGSNGSKGIKVSAGQIDSGYRGEWFVAWTNTNEIDVVLTKDASKWDGGFFITYPYEKAIAQAKVELVPQVNIVEKTVDEIMGIKSERGTGMLGSSNK